MYRRSVDRSRVWPASLLVVSGHFIALIDSGPSYSVPVPPPFICHALVMIDVETVEERAHSNLTFEKTQDSYQHFCDAPSNPVKRKMTTQFVFSMVLNRSKNGSVDAIEHRGRTSALVPEVSN